MIRPLSLVEHAENSTYTSTCILDNRITINSSLSNFGMDRNNTNLIVNVVTVVLSSFILIIGTLGNAHALIIFFQRYRQQTIKKSSGDPYIVFVLSLTIIGLFSCSFVLLLDIFYGSEQFPLSSDSLCRIFRYSQFYVRFSSLFHEAVISIHCWHKIVFPFRKQFRRKFALQLCISSNVLAILICIPIAIFSGYSLEILNGESKLICFLDSSFYGTSWSTTYTVVACTIFGGCLFILCLTHIALIRFRWHLRQQRKRNNHSINPAKEGENARKTTTILLMLMLVFLVSYIPGMVFASVTAIKKRKNILKGWNQSTFVAYAILSRFPYLNNALQPFIYAYKDNEFRKRLISMYSSFPQKFSFLRETRS